MKMALVSLLSLHRIKTKPSHVKPSNELTTLPKTFFMLATASGRDCFIPSDGESARNDGGADVQEHLGGPEQQRRTSVPSVPRVEERQQTLLRHPQHSVRVHCPQCLQAPRRHGTQGEGKDQEAPGQEKEERQKKGQQHLLKRDAHQPDDGDLPFTQCGKCSRTHARAAYEGPLQAAR